MTLRSFKDAKRFAPRPPSLAIMVVNVLFLVFEVTNATTDYHIKKLFN